MRWLEHDASRGLAGSDGAARAQAEYYGVPRAEGADGASGGNGGGDGGSSEVGSIGLADDALAHQCLLVIGLRSFSHARLCIAVLDSVARSKAVSPITLAHGAACRRQLDYARGADWAGEPQGPAFVLCFHCPSV
eukprot:SAG22_NODE_807_length_7081_cov_2.460756_6_plen_135_part_00